MRKSKMFIDNVMIDKIARSVRLDNNSKISFLKYVWYMTKGEREELKTLI